MKASDVRFVKLTTECPEQYDAIGTDGNLIGYVRVRWGFCTAWCPDAGSDNEVYTAKLKQGWWSFGSNKERMRNLHKVRAAISSWWNQQAP